MRVEYKKTIDLTDKEIQRICFVFETVFEGVNKNVEEFKNEFLNTCLGYSFHGLLYNENNEIVGANTYIPFKYIVDGKNELIGVGVDTMVMEEYRNFDNIMNLVGDGRRRLQDENFLLNIGFPNENSYPLYKKGFRDKEIGNLTIYILPYKIGGIKKELRYFNFLSISFTNILLLFSMFSREKKVFNTYVKRDLKSFEENRYKWFNPKEYKKITFDGINYSYKIKKYEGVDCAFLFNVYPLNKYSFDKAVRDLKRKEKKNISMIMYVGKLHFKPISLIKLPVKYEPKKFHFVGSLLKKTDIDEELLFNISNWDIDLASYDLI